MRVLKITALVALLTAGILSAVVSWLIRSEEGSRWLLEQGLAFAPVSIEAEGISGTLADGLGVEALTIGLTKTEIQVKGAVLSWSPTRLLAGIFHINRVHIAELSVDVVQTESAGDDSGDAPEDRLFWLKIPLYIDIESGQLDRLRIEKAEFKDILLAGRIGHGHLEIDSLNAEIAGTHLQVEGELAGPAPGRLEAIASWEIPAENLSGSGNFSGDIEELGFTQVIKVPEAVTIKGTMYALFHAPALTGVAEWQSVRLPGESALTINAGNIYVSSDFQSISLKGDSIMLLEGWPQAPLKFQALANLQGVTIDAYTLDALGGQINGSGHIDYGDDLQGQLAINAKQIDLGLIRSDLPGHLGFDATLLIESADAFAIDVSAAIARVADINLTGLGRVHMRGGELTAIKAEITAGKNQLSADITTGTQLAGTINARAPELATLWPGLRGELDASITLGGSPDKPQGRLMAQAASLSYGSQSLDALALSAELKSNNQLAGKLDARGLLAGEQALGDLEYTLAGTLARHQSNLKLNGGVVDVQLRANGGWDGEVMTQRFEYGLVQPDGFPGWRLNQTPELRVSAAGGQVSAHCWKQEQAGICINASSWSAESLQSAIVIDDFALASLQPLLAEGYSIDGTVNADLKLVREKAGLQAELRWRQSRTVLGYADDIDKFQTVLDEIKIDLTSDDNQTDLVAKINGEQGLKLTTTATVSGPLVSESPLVAAAKGRIPSIELLRPLLQRVVHPGELEGELTVDLKATGTLGNPIFIGGAKLADGSMGLVDAGITLSSINLSAQSDGADKLLVTGEFQSGEGSAKILGELHATEEPGLEADIRVQGQDLASVRMPDLSVDTSPDLRLRISEDVFEISGTLLIPRATAQIRDLPNSAVPRSVDVIVHEPERTVEQPSGTIVTGNVEVVLGDEVRFSGFGLNSRLEGGLRLTQARRDFLRTRGTVRVQDGFLTGYGRELRVDRGELTFVGPLDDPLINIQVSRESVYEGRIYIIGLRLTGSAQNVITEPFSRPSMPERDVLSFLLLDMPASSDSNASGAALALGLQQIVPGDSGILGLDEISFETNDANEAAMVAGRRINENLFVRYVFGTRGEPGSFRIRYTLGRGFSLEASTGSRQSLDLIYLLER
ncbi:MAG: translocation/assembly module TamB domain-containing protein [Gammaproteobacteria bacterium]